MSKDYVNDAGELFLSRAAAYRDPNPEDLTGRFDEIVLRPAWMPKEEFDRRWEAEFLRLDRYYPRTKPEEREEWSNVWLVYLPADTADGWFFNNRRIGQLHKEGDKWRVLSNDFQYFFWDSKAQFDTKESALRKLLEVHSEGALTK